MPKSLRALSTCAIEYLRRTSKRSAHFNRQGNILTLSKHAFVSFPTHQIWALPTQEHFLAVSIDLSLCEKVVVCIHDTKVLIDQ
jgi:hypothetical protein